MGRENCETYFKGAPGRFLDLQIEIHEIVPDGNLVRTECILSGTHEGSMKPSRQHTKREFGDVPTFVVEGGTPQEERFYFDRYEVLNQLGLLEE